jgi:hypothetical protein
VSLMEQTKDMLCMRQPDNSSAIHHVLVHMFDLIM